MGLGLLADGKWVSQRNQEDAQGKFIRPSTTFRNQQQNPLPVSSLAYSGYPQLSRCEPGSP
ncbi:hypothetical protein [Microseira sp. BLCC-F43]|jgi:glutathionyl-hydroquinone reductase|uniref:hypothetical protein n=1 Tax=Microseira sp. BLCC-F43 TaxID=3153602 RepID=UPI0035B94F5C